MTAERDEAGRPMEWRPKKFRFQRIHLEEDAGKNVHEGLPDVDRFSYSISTARVRPWVKLLPNPIFVRRGKLTTT